LADEIAYNAHDIDDGVRSGLLEMSQLDVVALFAEHSEAALTAYAQLADMPRRLLAEVLRRVLSAQVQDVIDAAQRQLDRHAPDSADAVRRLPALVCFSTAMREQSTQLKRFLFGALYRHEQVVQTTRRASDVVRVLFAAYSAAPNEMPTEHAAHFAQRGQRVVADYIAGMTDRFAAREYERLTGSPAFGRG
jgi:dGTPase